MNTMRTPSRNAWPTWLQPARDRRPALLLAAVLVVVLGGGLAGCGASLLPKAAPAPALYALDDGAPLPGARGAPGVATAAGAAGVATAAGAAGAASAAGTAAGARPTPETSLLISPPRAAPALDTRLMAYQRLPQRIEHYAQSEWLDTPARQLAPLLLRAMEAGGGFAAVLPAPAGAAARWRLDTELLRLQQDFNPPGGGASRLRLTLRAVLVDTSSRAVLATRSFDVVQAAPSDDAAGGAAAAQRAALLLAQQVAAWCAETVAAAPR